MGEDPAMERLKTTFPGWRFGSVWATVNSGPDRRTLTATRARDGVMLAAADPASLAEKIRREELRRAGDVT